MSLGRFLKGQKAGATGKWSGVPGKERHRLGCEEGVWIGKSVDQEPIIGVDTGTQQQTNPVVPAIQFPNPPFRPHQA